jgi:hypothetical protein
VAELSGMSRLAAELQGSSRGVSSCEGQQMHTLLIFTAWYSVHLTPASKRCSSGAVLFALVISCLHRQPVAASVQHVHYRAGGGRRRQRASSESSRSGGRRGRRPGLLSESPASRCTSCWRRRWAARCRRCRTHQRCPSGRPAPVRFPARLPGLCSYLRSTALSLCCSHAGTGE